MSKVDVAKWYDPSIERAYLMGFLYAILSFDPDLDDPMGVLDNVIDEVLVDAFKRGWVERGELEAE